MAQAPRFCTQEYDLLSWLLAAGPPTGRVRLVEAYLVRIHRETADVDSPGPGADADARPLQGPS